MFGLPGICGVIARAQRSLMPPGEKPSTRRIVLSSKNGDSALACPAQINVMNKSNVNRWNNSPSVTCPKFSILHFQLSIIP